MDAGRLLLVVTLLLHAGPARAGNLFDKLKSGLKAVDDTAKKVNEATGQPPAASPAPSSTSTSTSTGAKREIAPARQYADGDLTANGMDVLGVRIGMSLDETIATLRARGVSLTQTRRALTYPRAAGDAAAGVTAADPYEYAAVTLTAGDRRARPYDALTIQFTPEATPRAYRIDRQVALDAGTQLYAPWEQAVMEKYGQPMAGGSAPRTRGWAGGDFTWAKSPAAQSCGSTSADVQVPAVEQSVKAHADAVERCGPWILWVRASGQDPYLASYEVHLTGYGLMDAVTRDLWARVASHTQAREAANQQHAQELSAKKPDL